MIPQDTPEIDHMSFLTKILASLAQIVLGAQGGPARKVCRIDRQTNVRIGVIFSQQNSEQSQSN